MVTKPCLLPAIREFLREAGRKGGSVRNPSKGFGTKGNARKAALVRWAKERKGK